MASEQPYKETHAHNAGKTVNLNEMHESEEVLLDESDAFLSAFARGRRNPAKTLFMLYKGNYLKILLTFVFLALRDAIVIVSPIITAKIIDVATRQADGGVQKILMYFLVLAVLVAFNVIMGITAGKLINRVLRSVEENLRSVIVRKLQMLSIDYYKHMQSGKLQSKLLRDVEAVTELSRSLIGTSGVFPVLYSVIGAVGITITKNKVVFAFIIAMGTIAIGLTRIFRGKLGRDNRRFREESENMSAKMNEMMELIPVTKAHGLEDKEVAVMENRFRHLARAGYRLDKTNLVFGTASWAVWTMISYLSLCFNGILAVKGIISVGEIVLYNSYFSAIIGGFNTLINYVPVISKGLESVNSVGDILLAHDVENNWHKLKPARLKGNVLFDNVSFRYPDGDRMILDGFNLDVKAGETIAFVGASGCGKTTAINLVIGFGKVTDGRLLIDGFHINNFDLHSYRSQLAVVPQTPILFSGTIRDNITYGNENISDEQVMEAVRNANLEEFIETLPDGIHTMLPEHGGTLSGGQRQRIAIARAFVRDPSIVILDEATSALDTVSERQIQTAINNVAKGRTTFIVAHRLSTIRHADRIVVVDKGRCAEIGTYEELMEKKGAFYRLQTMQSE